jgi:beta-N-acetylhexosaminidase
MAEIRELAGSVIATGFPGTELSAETRRALQRLAPSGVVLFRRNLEDVGQIRALVADLHALPSRPLVSIDHEGGPVVRVGEPFTHFPSAAAISRGKRPELAYQVGRAMATELSSVGIDIDFAPVLDVDSNPANPIIGERSFGSDPAQVASFGIATMRGLLNAGVLPCGKHFPGHGDTDSDSHLELPVVRRERAILEATELLPFGAAIAAGIPMVMTAHVLYPALDPRVPATLSAPILQSLLRDRMRFSGVVVSDDLEMRAVSDHHDISDAAVASLRAGVDWLLVCNDLEKSIRVAERIVQDTESGTLEAAVLTAASARVRSLRTPPRPPLIDLPSTGHRALKETILALAEHATESA